MLLTFPTGWLLLYPYPRTFDCNCWERQARCTVSGPAWWCWELLTDWTAQVELPGRRIAMNVACNQSVNQSTTTAWGSVIILPLVFLHFSGCGVGLAVKADGICMSRSNLTAAYINPGGVTQEIFTMRKVSSNVAVFGSRTSQYTWFPGYAWRHLYCRGCNTHLGWRYDAERPDLVPKSFYGIRRGNVVPSVQPAEGLGPQELQEFFQAQNSVITPVYYTEDWVKEICTENREKWAFLFLLYGLLYSEKMTDDVKRLD